MTRLGHTYRAFELGRNGIDIDIVKIMLFLDRDNKLVSKMVLSPNPLGDEDESEEYYLTPNISPSKLRELADFLEQAIHDAETERNPE